MLSLDAKIRVPTLCNLVPGEPDDDDDDNDDDLINQVAKVTKSPPQSPTNYKVTSLVR